LLLLLPDGRSPGGLPLAYDAGAVADNRPSAVTIINVSFRMFPTRANATGAIM
jgi:hypothetical protein